MSSERISEKQTERAGACCDGEGTGDIIHQAAQGTTSDGRYKKILKQNELTTFSWFCPELCSACVEIFLIILDFIFG